ncbi:hypothetical protein L3X38_038741 [Prunus dulcis]|uniref:Uncharacterized protein n=1 Tax=Prunus dulcis TaxID=3755 RepID=A0AAD4V6X9_PRUDU|nr:hypothetical protein L3X38_038741 [Prunus dulcis]
MCNVAPLSRIQVLVDDEAVLGFTCEISTRFTITKQRLELSLLLIGELETTFGRWEAMEVEAPVNKMSNVITIGAKERELQKGQLTLVGLHWFRHCLRELLLGAVFLEELVSCALELLDEEEPGGLCDLFELLTFMA